MRPITLLVAVGLLVGSTLIAGTAAAVDPYQFAEKTLNDAAGGPCHEWHVHGGLPPSVHFHWFCGPPPT